MSTLWRELGVNLLIHLIYFVGVLYLVGWGIHLLSRMFYRMLGGGRLICMATGLIGTPIHELSHALMCLLFGHRIREMRLYRFDRQSGVMGYVNHTYDRRNFYHIMGNYFIGIAPIFLGTLFLCLLMRLLVPDAYGQFSLYLSDFADWQAQGYVAEQFLGVGAVFISFLTVLLNAIHGWQFWVFLLLALCVSLHMSLSWGDIRSSLTALPVLIFLLSVIHIALYFLPGEAYGVFTRALNLAGAYLAGILLFSLALSLCSLLLALPIALLRRLCRR